MVRINCYSWLLTPVVLLVITYINSIFYSLRIMQRVISLKPISVISISPQKQKRIRAHKFSDFPLHSPQCFPQPSHNDDLSIDNDNMPIFVSDELRSWLICNNLEGFLKVPDAPPHDELEKVASTIDLEEITEGTIQALTRLQAGGLQSVESPSTETLIQYFGEYSLSSKAYRTQGGEDPLFWEVARVLL